MKDEKSAHFFDRSKSV